MSRRYFRGTPAERLAHYSTPGPAPAHRPDLGPCIVWTGTTRTDGRDERSQPYGVLSVGTGLPNVRAHRFAYELEHGPIPDDLPLDHLCRVTLCVRPSHLEPVPSGENTRRGDAPTVSRAWRLALTECKWGHPFDEANTIQTPKQRVCRTCRAERQRRHSARRKAARAAARK